MDRPARQALLRFCKQAEAEVIQIKKNGGLVGWASTKFPPELAAALELPVLCPESYGAALASMGESGAFCHEAEELGYCADLCSYVRVSMAAAAGVSSKRKPMPKPDFLLCCNNICTQMVQWYQNLARSFQIPLFLLDFPYTGQEDIEASRISYLRKQFLHIESELSVFAGRSWSEEKFAEMCRSSVQVSELWNRICALQQKADCPVDVLELFDYMPALVSFRCDPRLPGLLRALLEEIENLPPVPAPKARLMLEGTPCWPHMKRIVEPLNRAGVKLAADTITPSLGFVYEDLDGLLRAYCTTINGSPISKGIDMRLNLCRERNIDGVLIHYNRSCRPWCGTLAEIGRALARDGRAVVSFDGDQADPSAFNPGQYEARVQGLLEMLGV